MKPRSYVNIIIILVVVIGLLLILPEWGKGVGDRGDEGVGTEGGGGGDDGGDSGTTVTPVDPEKACSAPNPGPGDKGWSGFCNFFFGGFGVPSGSQVWRTPDPSSVWLAEKLGWTDREEERRLPADFADPYVWELWMCQQADLGMGVPEDAMLRVDSRGFGEYAIYLAGEWYQTGDETFSYKLDWSMGSGIYFTLYLKNRNLADTYAVINKSGTVLRSQQGPNSGFFQFYVNETAENASSPYHDKNVGEDEPYWTDLCVRYIKDYNPDLAESYTEEDIEDPYCIPLLKQEEFVEGMLSYSAPEGKTPDIGPGGGGGDERTVP